MLGNRERYLTRWNTLLTERSSWDSHWQDILDHLMPRRQRFASSSTKVNVGTKQNQKIINNTQVRALRILASGMMAGITSPARPWFRLTTPDPVLSNEPDVRRWLDRQRLVMLELFARSNIYNALAELYRDMPAVGICPLFIEEDPEDVLRASVWPVGSYCAQNDHRGRVRTVFRLMSYTVENLVDKFGIENCSTGVREMHRGGNLDFWVEVLQVIERNDEQVPKLATAGGMPWRCVWLEVAADNPNDLLGVDGYNEYPVMVPRWSTVGENVYSECPGMDALGDIKMLQQMERKKIQAVEKIVSPPMQGPSELEDGPVSMLPGRVNYLAGQAGGAELKPAHTVDPKITMMDTELYRVEQRINGTFYADLFLMLAQSSVPNMTAREVDERHEEKMLQLGPVLERLQDELLDPLIDRTFSIMVRRGMVPVEEVPEALRGRPLKVEYISILAAAQKLVGTVGVERLAQFVMAYAAVDPMIADNLDPDELAIEYADLIGTSPKLIRERKDVDMLREERAKAQQAQQQAELAATGAGAAKDLSQASMTDDTALTRMLGSMDVGGLHQ